jgi:hypothetical protein
LEMKSVGLLKILLYEQKFTIFKFCWSYAARLRPHIPLQYVDTIFLAYSLLIRYRKQL